MELRARVTDNVSGLPWHPPLLWTHLLTGIPVAAPVFQSTLIVPSVTTRNQALNRQVGAATHWFVVFPSSLGGRLGDWNPMFQVLLAQPVSRVFSFCVE